MQKELDTGNIPSSHLIKKGVKPPEKTCRFFMLLMRFDNQSAQRRCQCQSHHRRNQNRNSNRNRKLFIHHAGHPAQKRNRQKDGRQNQRHRDHGTGHFFHRLNSSFTRRKFFLAHQAFNVLQHDNRIVHHNTDCQNQTEQRQQVNRKT